MSLQVILSPISGLNLYFSWASANLIPASCLKQVNYLFNQPLNSQFEHVIIARRQPEIGPGPVAVCRPQAQSPGGLELSETDLSEIGVVPQGIPGVQSNEPRN